MHGLLHERLHLGILLLLQRLEVHFQLVQHLRRLAKRPRQLACRSGGRGGLVQLLAELRLLLFQSNEFRFDFFHVLTQFLVQIRAQRRQHFVVRFELLASHCCRRERLLLLSLGWLLGRFGGRFEILGKVDAWVLALVVLLHVVLRNEHFLTLVALVHLAVVLCWQFE